VLVVKHDMASRIGFRAEGIGQGQPLADRMDIASLALQPSSPTSTRVPPLVGGCLPTRLAPLHLISTRAKGGQNAPPGPQANRLAIPPARPKGVATP